MLTVFVVRGHRAGFAGAVVSGMGLFVEDNYDNFLADPDEDLEDPPQDDSVTTCAADAPRTVIVESREPDFTTGGFIDKSWETIVKEIKQLATTCDGVVVEAVDIKDIRFIDYLRDALEDYEPRIVDIVVKGDTKRYTGVIDSRSFVEFNKELLV